MLMLSLSLLYFFGFLLLFLFSISFSDCMLVSDSLYESSSSSFSEVRFRLMIEDFFVCVASAVLKRVEDL